MQRVAYKAYHIFWGIFFLLSLVLYIFFALNIKGQEVKEGYEMLTDYEVVQKQDRSAPAGVRQKYIFRLEGVEEAYCQLMIFSSHQNVRIFLDGVCIYQMSPDSLDISGRSPGHVWNAVSFTEENNGDRVIVEITPVYKTVIGVTPKLYFGNKSDIVQAVMMDCLLTIIMSLVLIIIGFIYIFFIIGNFQQSDVEKNLLMLGYFSIQAGLWKLTDSEAIYLLFPGHPVFAQIPFMALMLMCVSFTLYIKEMYSTRNHVIWYIPCIAGFINMGLTLIFQFLEIADMRQMLPLTHLIIVMIAVVAVIMTINEVRTVGWNPKLKRTIWCIAICIAGAGLDMVVYYLSHGQSNTLLGMIGFMIYIFVLGMGSMQDVKKLMDIGIQAQKYEKMAYHDQLTGLYNRTAFVEYTGSEEFVAERCIVVVMDINNLKECNDKLGHDRGDIYIKECASAIQKCFGEIGQCYRMGGDEFSVLMVNGDLHLCKQKVQELQDMIASSNKVGNGFRMGIACGYKKYDRLLDYDINETARRADKVMYQQKFAMKEL